MSVCETSTTLGLAFRTDHAGTPTITLKPQRPEQKPLLVTLTGSTLTAGAIGVAVLLHQQTIHLARALLLLTPLILFVRNDYLNFLRLGPGGIPPTPSGYFKMSWLSIWALRNPFSPPTAMPHCASSPGLLGNTPLPKRNDARPLTAGIAPHRQITQYGTTQCFQALCQTLQSFASSNPSDFETRTSCLEKHGLALFAKRPARQSRFQGEICHVHDTDHSLHLFLNPEDITEVLRKGWGERHPMAWEWGPWKPVVGPYFVMIYAPRNENELRVVSRIIEAATWNMAGKEIQLAPYLPTL